MMAVEIDDETREAAIKGIRTVFAKEIEAGEWFPLYAVLARLEGTWEDEDAS